MGGARAMGENKAAGSGARKVKARPSIKALQPEQPPPFTAVPGVPAALQPAETKHPQDEEETGVRVPGVIPPNVLPLQSESTAGLVPRYSIPLERLLAARGERTTARLAFKGLGDAGAAELATILSSGTCKNLEGLDVSCNEVGAAGASSLAVALRTNHVLKTLDLSTNALGDQGITALADALTANSTLTFLDVHACGIHDSGATALAGALQNNCTLAVLNLKANYITDAGAIALAQVAIKSKTLKALITTSNDIERAGEKALEDAIYENENLVDFLPAEVRGGMR